MQRLLLGTLFSLSALLTYGQVTLVPEIENKEYRVNEPFTLTFLLEVKGNLQQESKLKLPDFSKFESLGNASQQQSAVVPAPNGELVNLYQLVYQCVLAPKHSGRIMIGSALVKVNGKMYKTEPFDIYVKEARKATVDIVPQHDFNVSLNLEVEDPSVYQYEPTVAVLRAYSKNISNFRKVKNVRYHGNRKVDIVPVPHSNYSIEEGDNGEPSQILNFYIIIPKEEGFIEVPAVTANVGNAYSRKSTALTSNKVKLKVKKLPENAPESFRNAVGDYKLDLSSLDVKGDVEVNKPITIKIKMYGKGNLSENIMPRLAASEDYQFYPPKYDNHVKVTDEGMIGDIVAEYIVVPRRAGNLKIKTETFAFFNPEKHVYQELLPSTLVVDVKTPEEIANARTPLERVNDYTNNVLEKVNTPIIKTEQLKIKEKDRLNWTAVITNFSVMLLLVGCGVVYQGVRKKRRRERELEKERLKPLGSIEETEREIRAKMTTDLYDYFDYLRDQLAHGRYEEWFKTLEELDNDIKNNVQCKSSSSFISELREQKGEALVHDYLKLQQDIQLYKYSPIKSSEDLQHLLQQVEKIYIQIGK